MDIILSFRYSNNQEKMALEDIDEKDIISNTPPLKKLNFHTAFIIPLSRQPRRIKKFSARHISLAPAANRKSFNIYIKFNAKARPHKYTCAPAHLEIQIKSARNENHTLVSFTRSTNFSNHHETNTRIPSIYSRPTLRINT